MIRNEIAPAPPLEWLKRTTERGEPSAQALIQNEQNFHNLKILKQSNPEREASQKQQDNEIKPSTNHKVFSQVSRFRFLQI